MKKFFLFFLFGFFTIIIACEKDSEKPKINSGIIKFKNDCFQVIPQCGYYFYGVCSNDNNIYMVGGFRKVNIDNNFNVLQDSTYYWRGHYKNFTQEQYDSLVLNACFPGMAMNISENSQNILFIRSQYVDVSIGAMCEFNVNEPKGHYLLDTSYNIGHAQYFRDDNHIIYYSYGKPYGTNAGYFLFDKTSGKSELIFSHISELAEKETINGFDIHPTQNKLLIPVVYASKSPMILEYNMDSHKTDTLNAAFDSQNGQRICLWLNYDKTGNQVLYCLYPRAVLSDYGFIDTEIGILDRANLSKRILDVNTEAGGKSVSIFSSWSPDDKHVLFSSAPLSLHHHSIGAYSLYILKNVNP